MVAMAVLGFPRRVGAVSCYLWKIDAKGIHVQAIQETGKALGEAGKTLVHKLELDKVLLEIGHGVAELGESILQVSERVLRRRGAAAALGTVA